MHFGSSAQRLRRLSAKALGGPSANLSDTRLTSASVQSMIKQWLADLTNKGSTSLIPTIHIQPKHMLMVTCCLIIVLIPTLLIVRDVGNHNAQLAAVATTLYTTTLPPATNELDRRAYIAVLGNGKACDYVAEQTLRTTLAHADILTYYHATNGSSNKPSNRTVAASYAAQYCRISLNHQLVSLIIPSQQETAAALTFTLQLVDGRDDAGLDLRCY